MEIVHNRMDFGAPVGDHNACGEEIPVVHRAHCRREVDFKASGTIRKHLVNSGFTGVEASRRVGLARPFETIGDDEVYLGEISDTVEIDEGDAVDRNGRGKNVGFAPAPVVADPPNCIAKCSPCTVKA